MQRFRALDRNLRYMLLATALLVVPQAVQLAAIAERNAAGRAGGLDFLVGGMAIFLVPTSLILSGAILKHIRGDRAKQQPLWLLGLINVLLAVSLILYAWLPCVWSSATGIALAGCR